MGLRERVTRDPAKAARKGLLLLVAVVSAAVAWSLLRPEPRAAETAPPPPAGTGTTVGELQFLRFRDDSRRIQVKAREMAGEQQGAMILRGVEASLPFVREGRAGTVTIRADECQYQQARERAAFKGNVVLHTDDGFELQTDSLKYWGDQERAFTRDPLRFAQGSLTGTATGLEYRTGHGVLLQDSVRMRIEDAAGGPPTDVESREATASREERLVSFKDGVVVRQGARELRSARLKLSMSEDMKTVERAHAEGEVELVSGPGAPAAAAGGPALPASSGTRRLRSQALEVEFQRPGVPGQALATGAASLEVEPGPGEAPEKRRIAGPRLRFDFDPEGRLAALHSPRGSARAAARERTTLQSEPLAGGGGPRRVESDTFVATLEPESGELERAEFEGSVVFTEPGRKAWAGHSLYLAGPGELLLTREPRILDEAEGSELRAREIRIATRTQGVTAAGNVRHEIKGKAGRTGPFGSGDSREPAVFVCREFEYDKAARRARYRDNAFLRSGEDELRAPLITLSEPAPGERRMRAEGGVTSTLHPRKKPGGQADAEGTSNATGQRKSRPAGEAEPEPAPVETRSREMVYEQAKSRVVYTGDVEIRQGDILTKSPEAVVLLSKDGETIERMLAGEPVEVRQGVRRANGERGTYTPANETFVLTGERVVLHDGDRRLEGRILTFEVGSDRIRVDGREERRTEAVFRRKELQKP